MAQNITYHVKDMVAEANKHIEAIPFEKASEMLGNQDIVFVDIRDVRELWREGKIPGAFHAPRGMLEFWVDPKSPYYKPIFNEDKTFLFYCGSGWRSALATHAVQKMGLAPVCHLEGGFTNWHKQGGDIEEVSK